MFVVYWHNILPETSGPWDNSLPRVTVDSFERQVGWLARHFTPCGICEALESARPPRTGDRRLALSFDDGFRGVKDYALPVLQKLGWSATIFVLENSGESNPETHLMHAERLEIAFRISGESTFNQQPLTTDTERCDAYRETKSLMKTLNLRQRDAFCREIAAKLKVTDDEIVSFAQAHPEAYAKLSPEDCGVLCDASWTIGSHTHHHLHLSQLAPDQIRSEIGSGNRCLDRRNQKFFAYPYGDSNAEIAEIVRTLGFDAAFTTKPRPISNEDNRYLLPRMSFGSLWNRAKRRYRSTASSS